MVNEIHTDLIKLNYCLASLQKSSAPPIEKLQSNLKSILSDLKKHTKEGFTVLSGELKNEIICTLEDLNITLQNWDSEELKDLALQALKIHSSVAAVSLIPPKTQGNFMKKT